MTDSAPFLSLHEVLVLFVPRLWEVNKANLKLGLAGDGDPDYESGYQRTLRIARCPGDPAGTETGTKSGRDPDQGPCDDGQPD